FLFPYTTLFRSFLSFYLFIFLSFYLLIFLSSYLSISLSFYLFITDVMLQEPLADVFANPGLPARVEMHVSLRKIGALRMAAQFFRRIDAIQRNAPAEFQNFPIQPFAFE